MQDMADVLGHGSTCSCADIPGVLWEGLDEPGLGAHSSGSCAGGAHETSKKSRKHLQGSAVSPTLWQDKARFLSSETTANFLRLWPQIGN